MKLLIFLVLVLSHRFVQAEHLRNTNDVTICKECKDFLCGKVQNLQLEEKKTELTVHWEPPYNPENGVPICSRFYHIDYSINGVDADTVTLHRYTNYTITKGSCAYHWIGIRSSELTGAPAALAEVEYISGIVGSGAVQNLAEYNGNVVWDRPELYENCTLTYSIHMHHQFGESTYTTEDLLYPLPTIPCLKNTVTVTANVLQNGRDGEPRYITHTVPESSLAPVHVLTNPTNVGADVDGQALNPLLNACEISHIEFEILHDGTTRIQVEPFDRKVGEVAARFTGFRVDIVQDITYTARWILASGFKGDKSEPIRFLTYNSCGRVQNTEIEETETELILRWEPPYDPGNGIPICGIFYYIAYSTNGAAGTPVIFHSDTNFSITKGSCAHHWIGIRSSEFTGAPASQYEVEYLSGIVGSGAVQNLADYNGNVVWDRPDLSENCTLTYSVHMDHQFGESTYTTEDLLYPLPTIPCLENTVTVTVNVLQNGRDGEPRYITHTAPELSLAPVHVFTNPTNVGADVRWALSPQPNACEISHIEFEILHDGTSRIQVEPFDREIGEVTARFTGFRVNTVHDITYTARWILASGFKGDRSEPIRFLTYNTCGRVRNIEIEETATELIVHWEPPYNPENEVPICSRFYHIDYSINGVDADTVIFQQYTNYTITKGSCAYHWIGIRSTDLTGAPAALAEVEYISGIVGNGAVQNLAEYNGNAVWGRPELSENCTLFYFVIVIHEFGRESLLTPDLFYPLPTIPCAINSVWVSAKVLENGEEGELRNFHHLVPQSSLPPVHVFTNPTNVGADVRWRLSPEPSACQFYQIEFEIEHEGATRAQIEPFNQTGEVTTHLVGFPEDVVNDVTYTARWVLTSGFRGDRSEKIRFLTVPLENPK